MKTVKGLPLQFCKLIKNCLKAVSRNIRPKQAVILLPCPREFFDKNRTKIAFVTLSGNIPTITDIRNNDLRYAISALVVVIDFLFQAVKIAFRSRADFRPEDFALVIEKLEKINLFTVTVSEVTSFNDGDGAGGDARLYNGHLFRNCFKRSQDAVCKVKRKAFSEVRARTED